MLGLTIGLNFATVRRDTLTIQGTFPTDLNRGNLQGNVVTLDVGGVASAFSLDRKGTAALFTENPRRFDTLRFTARRGIARYSVTLRQGDLKSALANDGLIDGSAGSATLPVTLTIGTFRYSTTVTVLYTSSGRRGRATLVK